jgi:mannitol 2-dehydrogenase
VSTLGAGVLSSSADAVPAPTYDRSRVTAGVVHFGVGGFHRAHQAMYHDRLMNDGKALDWGICGVGVMPADRRMKEALDAQGRALHARRQAPRRNVRARVIGAVIEYLFAPDDPEAVIEKLAAEATRIVSLTVTEGGYNINDVTGEFDAANPDVVHDLDPGATPRTTFGLMIEALRRRRGARARAVHDHVLRQPAGQRPPLANGVHGLRSAARPGARRLGRARGALPQLDGRPDHAADDRCRPSRAARAVRR